LTVWQFEELFTCARRIASVPGERGVEMPATGPRVGSQVCLQSK